MDKLKVFGALLKRNKKWVVMIVFGLLGVFGVSEPERFANIIDLLFSFLWAYQIV